VPLRSILPRTRTTRYGRHLRQRPDGAVPVAADRQSEDPHQSARHWPQVHEPRPQGCWRNSSIRASCSSCSSSAPGRWQPRPRPRRQETLMMNGDQSSGLRRHVIGKAAAANDLVIIVMPESRSRAARDQARRVRPPGAGIDICTNMYADMPAPREIVSPLAGGATDVLSEWRITSGWGRPSESTRCSRCNISAPGGSSRLITLPRRDSRMTPRAGKGRFDRAFVSRKLDRAGLHCQVRIPEVNGIVTQKVRWRPDQFWQ